MGQKSRQWAGLVPWAIVCWPCKMIIFLKSMFWRSHGWPLWLYWNEISVLWTGAIDCFLPVVFTIFFLSREKWCLFLSKINNEVFWWRKHFRRFRKQVTFAGLFHLRWWEITWPRILHGTVRNVRETRRAASLSPLVLTPFGYGFVSVVDQWDI